MAYTDLLSLATAWNVPEQAAIIDSLTKESGILRTMRFDKASHGLFHKYKVGQALPSGGFRLPNGGIVPHSTLKTMQQEDLKILSDIDIVDKAIGESWPGGVAGYFDANTTEFIEGLGQTAGRQLVYGTDATFGSSDGFLGLRQHAVANSKTINAGGTSGKRTTILAVRWVPGKCCGLYSAEAAALGNLITATPVNNGALMTMVTDTTTGAVKPVYQVLYEAYTSLLVADSAFVAAYVSVSNETGHTPTASNINALLDLCKSNGSDTYIYCNRYGRSLLYDLKDSKIKTTPADNAYNTMIESWNGARIVLEENISSTETI